MKRVRTKPAADINLFSMYAERTRIIFRKRHKLRRYYAPKSRDADESAMVMPAYRKIRAPVRILLGKRWMVREQNLQMALCI